MKTTIAIITAVLITGFCSAANKVITFQKKKNHKKEVQLNQYATLVLKTTDGKLYRAVLIGSHDSVLVFKKRNLYPQGFTAAENARFKEIAKDKSLSDSVRMVKLRDVFYPDSLQLPMSSIRRIQYCIGDTKNGKLKVAISSGISVAADLFEVALIDESADYNSNVPNDGIIKTPVSLTDALIMPLAVVNVADYYYVFRNIHTRKWQIKA